MHQFVSFLLKKEIFAVDVMKIRGVERMLSITSIPTMPDFLEGVINLRGTIIPIVDLRKRFKLGSKEPDKETRIILTELETGLVVGMIVDAVKEVFQVDSAEIGDVPKIGAPNMDQRFIKGVTNKKGTLVILLDAERILTESETEGLKSLEQL